MTGFHEAMPRLEYDSTVALNWSTARHLLRSPAHCRHYLMHRPSSTAAQSFGIAVHTAVLEPEKFEDEFTRAPDVDRRTKAGKAAWAEHEALSGFRTPLTCKEWAKCEAIRDRVLAHPRISELLLGDGVNEASVVWEDATGVTCKGRLDRLCQFEGRPTVVDLKTCMDASYFSFERSIAKYKYHGQAAWYLRGLRSIADIGRRFLWLAVEKEPPYEVAIYEADALTLDEGDRLCAHAMNLWKECQESGDWPGYDTGINVTTLPEWALEMSG